MPKYELSTADALIELFRERGIIPPNCRRFVIDIQVGEVPKIYTDAFIDAETIRLLAGIRLERANTEGGL